MSEIENTPDWNSLPGVILDGGYELKEIIEAQKDLAIIRVRVLGDYSLSAFATFYSLSRADAKRQVERWQTLRALDAKNNLCIPLGTGIVTLNTSCLAYLVSQNAEETLAEVIEQRRLSPEEAIEAVRSLTRGLEQLHEHGLVHGTIAPSEIWAIGDDIKLTTDTVRDIETDPLTEFRKVKYLAPESDKHNSTPAADVWCFGATVFEAATQKTFDAAHDQEVESLPHPLALLVERCTEKEPAKRCKVSEIEAILRSKTPPPKPKPVAPPPAPAAKTVEPERPAEQQSQANLPLEAENQDLPAGKEEPTLSGSAASVAGASVPTPAERSPNANEIQKPAVPRPRPMIEPSDSGEFTRNTRPEVKPSSSLLDTTQPKELPYSNSTVRSDTSRIPDEEKVGSFAGGRGWVYAIAAFLAIFFLLWLLRGCSSKKVATSAHAPQSTAALPTEGKPAWQTHTLSPDAKSTASSTPLPTPSRNAHRTPTTTPSDTGSAKNVWRVVFFTYNRQEDAARKAQEINTRHPDLQAQVFASNDAGPFLVVAAGQGSKAEATRLRQRALHEGMPRDSYIQNYNR